VPLPGCSKLNIFIEHLVCDEAYSSTGSTKVTSGKNIYPLGAYSSGERQGAEGEERKPLSPTYGLSPSPPSVLF